jgi:hypothetical protein
METKNITYNQIIEEINQIPIEHLTSLYYFIHSFNKQSDNNKLQKENLLKFAGSWADMSENDFKEYIEQTQIVRNNLMDRNIDI